MAGLASATSLLYVASYAGTLTTLVFTTDATTGQSSLQTVATVSGCGNASWLTLDHPNRTLYCLDEAIHAPDSTLFRFRTNRNGTLTPLDQVAVPNGAVSSVIYGLAGKELAIASYEGGAISTYNIASSPPTHLHTSTFHLPHPGPNPDHRQDAPHPHQAITDLTGRFLFVPDLGADLVRVWAINSETLELTPAPSLVVTPPGSGPRHGVFLQSGKKTFFYLLCELANTIIVYQVSYETDGMLEFAQVYVTGTHGEDGTVPRGAAAAEIIISPCTQYLIISSRLEGTSSDPLITFAINHDTGVITHHSTVPAGGLTPRHFSLNNAGTLVAVGLQGSGRVAIFPRDTDTGVIGDVPLAFVDGLGEVTAVVFGGAGYVEELEEDRIQELR
ncbi:hypothetical protein DL546_008585 [Coniochaeta pulveracea]|uniref:6-phosphogluconolactonase n=1 Tax=Coniochaeta pulveracea TaxID=177199 RepID=A0A420YDE8_9PEZI|nr:hypothetical protein DL546_008585 [Coniochaeta pulveracea]